MQLVERTIPSGGEQLRVDRLAAGSLWDRLTQARPARAKAGTHRAIGQGCRLRMAAELVITSTCIAAGRAAQSRSPGLGPGHAGSDHT